jgi:hypothetical protein
MNRATALSRNASCDRRQREGPMKLSTFNIQHSTRRKASILALLCAAVIAVFVLLPRGSALELYTTPPLDSKGTRIQLLIPRGWRLEMTRDSPAHTSFKWLPQPFPTWYPTWLTDALHDPHGNIWVQLSWTTIASGATSRITFGDFHVPLRAYGESGNEEGRGAWDTGYCVSDYDRPLSDWLREQSATIDSSITIVP